MRKHISFQSLTTQSAGVTMKVRSRIPKLSMRFPLPEMYQYIFDHNITTGLEDRA